MNELKYISIIILFFITACKTDEEKYIELGNNYFSKSQFEIALENFTKAVDINPQNKSALHDIGRCYENLDNFEQAIVYYSLAIDIDSLYSVAYRSRGFARYKTKDFEHALLDYQKSLMIEPDNSTAYSNSGSICEKLCDFKQAREYYYKTLKLNPNHYGVMTSLANIEFDFGNYDKCIELCNKAIGNLTENKDAPHATLGLAYNALEKYDSAIYHLTIALDFNKNCHTFNNRGYAFSCLDKYENAILDFNKAIQMDSLIPSFYLNRGDALYGLNRYRDAIQDYNKSIEVSSLYAKESTGIIYNNRAYAKKTIGDLEGFNEDIKKARLQGFPEKYTGFSNLEKCNY